MSDTGISTSRYMSASSSFPMKRRWVFGWNIPTTSRIQFVGEATAEVFVGGHTPNTTFGAEDPVDLTGGLRFDVTPRVILRAAYRRPVNQSGRDKNGFVVSASFGPF